MMKNNQLNMKIMGEIVNSANMAYFAYEKMLFKDQNGLKPPFRIRKQIEEDKKVKSKST